MIGCDAVRLLLGPFLDGELADEPNRDVKAHCESCTDCRRALERLRALGNLLHQHAPPPPPSGLTARVMTAVRHAHSQAEREARPTAVASEPRRWSFQRAIMGGHAALAACLVLGAFLGGWLAYGVNRQRVEPLRSASKSLGSYVPVFKAEYVSDSLYETLAEGYLTMDSVCESREK